MANGQFDFQAVMYGSFSPLHLLGLSAIFGGSYFSALRWRVLLRLQGLTFKTSIVLRWTLISNFFGLALPGGAWTEMSRAYYMFRSSPNCRIAALSSIILDRILALGSLILMGFLSFIALVLTSDMVDDTIGIFGVIMGGILMFTIGGFLLVGYGPVRRVIKMPLPEKYGVIIDAIIVSYVSRKIILAQSFALSFIAHVFILSAFFFAAEILSTTVGWKEQAIAMPLVMISNVLPLTPSGIGVGETVSAFIFALFGIGNGAAIMLVARIWFVAVQLFGGAVYLFHRHEEAA